MREEAARPGEGPLLERLAAAYLHFADRQAGLLGLMFRPRLGRRANHAALDTATGECLAEFVAAVDREEPRLAPEESIRRAVQAWSAAHGFAVLRNSAAFGALDAWMLPAPAQLLHRPSRHRGR